MDPLGVVLVIVSILMGGMVFIKLYVKALERMNYDPQTFSERWVLGPILAGRPLWVIALIAVIVGTMSWGIFYIQFNPFWENNIEAQCVGSGGDWYETGSKNVQVKCAMFVNNSQYQNTLLDLGSDYRVDYIPLETIGFCRCAEHSCWDEASETCIPGEVFPQ